MVEFRAHICAKSLGFFFNSGYIKHPPSRLQRNARRARAGQTEGGLS